MRFPILFCSYLALGAYSARAQVTTYTMQQAHSHNDYERSTPFYAAASLQFGSIEADIHLKDGRLYVAHDPQDIRSERTLKNLYILPVIRQFELNNGKVYPNGQSLQLLIDIKTAAGPALQALTAELQPYRRYFDRSVNPDAVKVVLSGNLPPAATWASLDPIFFFDGRPDSVYDDAARKRIAMVSTGFGQFSNWNGKGTLVPKEWERVQAVISKVHTQGFPFRFWGAPSSKTTYYKLMEAGADFIGTDHPVELFEVLQQRKATTTAGLPQYDVYRPTYASDATAVRSKNVILMIGDGTGLAQMFAGYTANRGKLNIFMMKQLGLSKTQSTDNYHTDSAAGASAMSTGQKTYNRAIGMDNTYTRIPVLPEILAPKGIASGVVVTERITGATPASFYGHTADRDSTTVLAGQLPQSKLQLAVGGGKELFGDLSAAGIQVYDNVESWNEQTTNRTLVLLSAKAMTSMREGRGSYLKTALRKALTQLSRSGKGFFLMVEGSRIDHGGHKNDLDYLVREMLDFDDAVGEALRFADKDKQTTVIVTADHETGGLSLMDGDIAKGQLTGYFATNDHTGIPVMVFAYGTGSALFRGVYENNEIFQKILRCYGL